LQSSCLSLPNPGITDRFTMPSKFSEFIILLARLNFHH
jgi:hypothetical protein